MARLSFALFLCYGCTSSDPPSSTIAHSLKVTAMAYNSLPSQTHPEHPTTAAWGDGLTPGMKCVAVSRDLLDMVIDHLTEVLIDGLSGTYLVLDKMNDRKSKAIDIYMGVDKDAAMEWGRKEVVIRWETPQKAVEE